MPDLVRSVVVTAIFVETVIAWIVCITQRGAARARLAGAARVSVARARRIVNEAQDLLVPIREDAPKVVPSVTYEQPGPGKVQLLRVWFGLDSESRCAGMAPGSARSSESSVAIREVPPTEQLHVDRSGQRHDRS